MGMVQTFSHGDVRVRLCGRSEGSLLCFVSMSTGDQFLILGGSAAGVVYSSAFAWLPPQDRGVRAGACRAWTPSQVCDKRSYSQHTQPKSGPQIPLPYPPISISISISISTPISSPYPPVSTPPHPLPNPPPDPPKTRPNRSQNPKPNPVPQPPPSALILL